MFDFRSCLVPLTTTPSESTQIFLLSKQSSHVNLLVADEVEREPTLSMHCEVQHAAVHRVVCRVVCQVGEHQHQLARAHQSSPCEKQKLNIIGLWEWDIYGINGWDSYGKVNT